MSDLAAMRFLELIVMGIMNGKFALNGGRLYYFYLQRV